MDLWCASHVIIAQFTINSQIGYPFCEVVNKNLNTASTQNLTSSSSSSYSTMKKLRRKSTVHPSTPIISDFLSFLPAAIFAITAALSADDKEVLAYLISCSNTNTSSRKAVRKISGVKSGVDHAPVFDCDCFMCYRRYWARWDSSPNRQLIHEVIEAYEDGLAKSKGTSTSQRNCKKERRKKNNESDPGESNRSESSLGKGMTNKVSDSVQKETGDDGNGKDEEEEERGSVRRFVSFVGEKIWNAWG